MATLLSLLAAAIRKGQQQCYLPPGICNQDLESLLSISAGCTLTSPGPRPSDTACASTATSSTTQRSSVLLPSHRAQAPQPAAPHNAVPFFSSQPPFPVSQALQGSGWMSGRLVLVLVVLFIASAATIRPLNQWGPLQWQKGVNGCRHRLSAYSSCLNSSHNSSLARRAFLTFQMRSSLPHSTNQRHPAPHGSLFHRQLLPCLSCGTVQKLATYLLALQEMTTWKTFSAMRSLNVSSSTSARRRTAAARKASKERRKGCCSWRPRPDGMQDRPDPDSLSSDLSSTKKTQWVGWTVNVHGMGALQEMASRGVQSRFLLAQETHLPKDALATEESWMRLQGWRACVAPAPFRSPQSVSTKQTARSKGTAGVMVTAALRHGLGDAARRCWRQGHRAAFHHSGIVPGGAGSFGLHAHWSRARPGTLANPQHDRPVDHLPRHCRSPSVATSRWPEQLEDSGWVRAAGGFVVAPQLATVTPPHPGHRFRRLPRPRRRV